MRNWHFNGNRLNFPEWSYLLLLVHILSCPSSSMMLHHHLMDLKDLDKAIVVEERPQIYSKDLQKMQLY